MRRLVLAAVAALFLCLLIAPAAQANGLAGFGPGCVVGSYAPWNAGWTDFIYYSADHWAYGIGTQAVVGGGGQCQGDFKEVGAQLWDDSTGQKVDDTGLNGSYAQTIYNGDPNSWCIPGYCNQGSNPPGPPNDGYPCQSGHVYSVWAYAYAWAYVNGWRWVYGQVNSGNYGVC